MRAAAPPFPLLAEGRPPWRLPEGLIYEASESFSKEKTLGCGEVEGGWGLRCLPPEGKPRRPPLAPSPGS